MKIAVVGLWHLGSVTAACLANANFDVIAFDPDQATIDGLKNNRAPIVEPGLDTLIQQGQEHNHLAFTTDKHALAGADLVWITFDTPVDDQDVADVDHVIQEIHAILPYLKPSTTILISSQLPVGTTRRLLTYAQNTYPDKHFSFAYSPENLRLGKAISVFQHPDRIVIGLASEEDKTCLEAVLRPFTSHLLWMSLESAEMTKHALNAFLATSVVFVNELASLCERVGANARDVERSLKSEERIGPKAYLRPGPAIAGGTLARDVNFLTQIGQQHTLATPLFSSILLSNTIHKQWVCRRIQHVFGNLHNKKIAVLGLAYKVGTDTLRRSTAIETCLWLHQQGAQITAFDPSIQALPPELAAIITLYTSAPQALQNADALVLATDAAASLDLPSEQILSLMQQPHVFDAGGTLIHTLGHHTHIHYHTVGGTHEISRT